MQRIQEVPDSVFYEVKKLLEQESYSATFDEIFDISLKVEKRKRDCGFTSTISAYCDIMY